jgi:hypothetical protein
MVTRKALIVGINQYKPPAGPNLRGCINDAQNIAYTLNACGIVPATPKTMKILTDAYATRAKILAGLAWLIKGAKKGDVLVYYHSGHGTQYADLDGDEIDQKDEALCPYDIATAGALRDDDLKKVFSKIPAGVNLEVIVDTCHSGTVTRNPTFSGADTPDGKMIRFMEPPLDYSFFMDADPTIPTKKLLSRRTAEKVAVTEEMNHVLWAACQDKQTSEEGTYEGKQQGAFTFCFCKLVRAHYGTGITRARLDGLVGQALKKLRVSQIPQLEGTRETLKEKIFT